MLAQNLRRWKGCIFLPLLLVLVLLVQVDQIGISNDLRGCLLLLEVLILFGHQLVEVLRNGAG